MLIPVAMASPTHDTIAAPMADDETLSLLAQSYLHNPKHLNTFVIPQFRHRLTLMSKFNIPAGSRILELGCGQGETTLVLAHLVGPTGHITGVDPARPDYGHPITVTAARNHILASPLGSRTTFHAMNPLEYLKTLPEGHNFDFIILSHSLWYFPSHEAILETLAAIGPYAPRLLVAEYNFGYTIPEQKPHVLAAKCQAVFYKAKTAEQRAATEPNVRTAPEVDEVRELAAKSGWKLVEGREGVVTPIEEVLDGQWEVTWVCFYDQFWEEVESVLGSTDGKKLGVKKEVARLKQETRCALDEVNMKRDPEVLDEKDVSGCRTMDVWWAEFERV